MSERKVAVVAFGGNVLIGRDEPGHQDAQMERAEALARALADFVSRGWRLLLVHGNGPQVGNSLIRMEESVAKLPPLSLDACVAETEGSIGYFLEMALRNVLGPGEEVVSVLSVVEVAADDERLVNPTKPIGPFYTPYRADYMVRMFDWDLVEDSGRGYRRVVPSPHPVRVLNDALVSALLDRAAVVVAGGGGGIPVTRRDGKFVGVEAVIDKDYTAALLARAVDAELFINLTAVDHVSADFGGENERRIERMTASEAEERLAAGEFPPGSMGPKIHAAAAFAKEGGGTVIITSMNALEEALTEQAGTWIVSDKDGIVPDEAGGGGE